MSAVSGRLWTGQVLYRGDSKFPSKKDVLRHNSAKRLFTLQDIVEKSVSNTIVMAVKKRTLSENYHSIFLIYLSQIQSYDRSKGQAEHSLKVP